MSELKVFSVELGRSLTFNRKVYTTLELRRLEDGDVLVEKVERPASGLRRLLGVRRSVLFELASWKVGALIRDLQTIKNESDEADKAEEIPDAD